MKATRGQPEREQQKRRDVILFNAEITVWLLVIAACSRKCEIESPYHAGRR